ncbi:MAG: hypothetical protein JNL42_03665 [Anaerolineae bacterium]|nr:hypothetical protein [Anaerolineae bacterium]
MRPTFRRDYVIVGASIGADGADASGELCISRGRIIETAPRRAARIDLSGCVILPALVNAHDHLELNHYPRTRYRERYDNAHRWGEDVNAHLNDSHFRRLRAFPLWDRLFLGGLKNLLCGALTVAHHNPPHRELFRRDFPVRVLRRYGWAHSLHFNSDAEIVKAFRRTPRNALFFIHLAEGTDDTAAGEYRRLKALGAVGTNTVLVHGVGLTPDDIADAAPRVRALVTCPTTNRWLLGRTADLDAWRSAGGDIWLGSDSRLTADGDLLDEIAALAQPDDSPLTVSGRFRAEETFGPRRSVSTNAAGSLIGRGDWIALRADARLPIRRADLALVVRGGVPQIGDPAFMGQFPALPTVPAILDGQPKAICSGLAEQIRRCALQESGLTLQ